MSLTFERKGDYNMHPSWRVVRGSRVAGRILYSAAGWVFEPVTSITRDVSLADLEALAAFIRELEGEK